MNEWIKHTQIEKECERFKRVETIQDFNASLHHRLLWRWLRRETHPPAPPGDRSNDWSLECTEPHIRNVYCLCIPTDTRRAESNPHSRPEFYEVKIQNVLSVQICFRHIQTINKALHGNLFFVSEYASVLIVWHYAVCGWENSKRHASHSLFKVICEVTWCNCTYFSTVKNFFAGFLWVRICFKYIWTGHATLLPASARILGTLSIKQSAHLKLHITEPVWSAHQHSALEKWP